MCLAWTTPASLVETVVCQGQQRYLAKHQLRPPKCHVSSGPVHPQTLLRQGRICCRSQMQSLQALQLSWMFCNCAQLLHGHTIVTYHVFQVPQRQPLLQLLQQLQQQLLWLDRQRFRRARRRRSWGTGHCFFAINLGSCAFESQEDEASWPTQNPWGLEWLELGMIFFKNLTDLKTLFCAMM